MSDYYGSAILEDWLAEEVFLVPHGTVPPEVVALFERWRGGIEYSIESWMDSDDGEGRRSWRGWGRGMYGIPEDEWAQFDEMVDKAKLILPQ